MDANELVRITEEWIAADPDPETADQLRALVKEGRMDELRELMDGELEFGTAGLRAVVGPGALRMNSAVIRRTTKAVADYLLRAAGGKAPLCVVGCDARLSSPGFLRETVQVLAAAGVAVRYFDEPVATPIVAFAARHLGADAAVVITASHNPPEYNGYKLYGSNAVQIVPPVDAEVAALIRQVSGARDVPIATNALADHSLVKVVPSQVLDLYFKEVAALRPSGAPARDLSIVYSAMHGVGYAPVRRALSEAGFTNVHPVAEQVEPDGHFPTVRFPNPEEKGALDLSLALGDKLGAQLILANDPDVDRLAACVRSDAGKWVPLTGNQIGLLLADFVLSRAPKSPRPLTVSSIVSSPMLGSIAQAYGARFEQTLTGFKWVWNAALDLQEAEGVQFAFGYEEALGYCVGRIVRDKDGISAAVILAELAAALHAEGSSLYQHLAELYRKHGLWISVQHSVVREGSAGQKQLRDAIDSVGANPPKEICGMPVTQFVDYRTGEQDRPRWLHDNLLLELRLGDSGRVLLRPSGTEPKLKVYVDLRVALDEKADVWQAESPAVQRAKEIGNEIARLSGLS